VVTRQYVVHLDQSRAQLRARFAEQSTPGRQTAHTHLAKESLHLPSVQMASFLGECADGVTAGSTPVTDASFFQRGMGADSPTASASASADGCTSSTSAAVPTFTSTPASSAPCVAPALGGGTDIDLSGGGYAESGAFTPFSVADAVDASHEDECEDDRERESDGEHNAEGAGELSCQSGGTADHGEGESEEEGDEASAHENENGTSASVAGSGFAPTSTGQHTVDAGPVAEAGGREEDENDDEEDDDGVEEDDEEDEDEDVEEYGVSAGEPSVLEPEATATLQQLIVQVLRLEESIRRVNGTGENDPASCGYCSIDALSAKLCRPHHLSTDLHLHAALENLEREQRIVSCGGQQWVLPAEE
jgi:hypothetical protein